MALNVSVDELVSASKNPLLAVPPHWSRIRLGEVGTVLNGFAFKSSRFSRDEGMPLVRIRDVGGDSTDTRYDGDYDDRYVVRAGDLLVGMDGDFHCARWRGAPALLNQRVCKVSIDPNVYEPRLLDYALPGYLRAINEATSSITVKRLSSRSIENIPLPLPPIDEQSEIVEELEKQFSRLDEAVANLQRVKANLNRYASAMLSAATEGRLGVASSTDYESAEQPRTLAIEGSSLPTLPVGWRWSTTGTVIDAFEAGASFKCIERPPEGDEVGVLKVSALTWGTYDEAESKTCPDPSRIHQRFMVRPGDFLLSRANTIDLVGACVIVGDTTKRLMLSDKTLRLRLKLTVVPGWLQCCLRSKFGRAEIERLATGNQESMRNIGQERIRQVRMPLPPLAEQHRIVAEVDLRLSIVRGVEADVNANLRRAQALRQAVLARAFGHGGKNG